MARPAYSTSGGEHLVLSHPATVPHGLEVEREKPSDLGLPAAVDSTIYRAQAPSTPGEGGTCLQVLWEPNPQSIVLFYRMSLHSCRSTLMVVAADHNGFDLLHSQDPPDCEMCPARGPLAETTICRFVLKWELQSVLDGLSGPPFEPLHIVLLWAMTRELHCGFNHWHMQLHWTKI